MQAVDLAGNRSPLSPGPVVHLIDVVPPRAPVLTGVFGGDREIVLQWAPNREPDLALYRLYRAPSAALGADVRQMELVASFILDEAGATAADLAVGATAEAVPGGRGQLRHAAGPFPGATEGFYRLVAVDRAGNASPPSRLAQGRAYDASRAGAPTWNPPAPGPDGLALSWSAPDASLTCLVQRRARGAPTWGRLSSWLGRGVYAYTDARREPGRTYEYRLLVLDGAGRTSAEQPVVEH